MLTNYFRLFFRLLCCGDFCCAHVWCMFFWCVGFFPMCCVNFNIWLSLCRDSKMRVLKLEYTVQQDAVVQY
jgi:hypothetical protein